MKLELVSRVDLADVTFSVAVLVWMVSLATMMHVGWMIAPFSIPLFVLGLVGRFTWRRAVLGAMGLGWAGWLLWVALA